MLDINDEKLKRGYVRLFRAIDSWEWYTDVNTFKLFIHCLIKANHTDKNWRGKIIQRGSFVTSLEKLSTESGLTKQQVRTALNKLEITHEITRSKGGAYTLIVIKNYDLYQGNNTNNNTEITHEQHRDNTEITTTNNVNNDNNDNNILFFKEENFKKITTSKEKTYSEVSKNLVDNEDLQPETIDYTNVLSVPKESIKKDKENKKAEANLLECNADSNVTVTPCNAVEKEYKNKNKELFIENSEKNKNIEENFLDSYTDKETKIENESKNETKKIDPYINPINEYFSQEYLRIMKNKPYLMTNQRNKLIELATEIENFKETIPECLEKLKNVEFDLPNFTPNYIWLLNGDNYIKVLSGTYNKKKDIFESYADERGVDEYGN